MIAITVNNTGGSVDHWAVSPALPSGVRLINGFIYGSARVNSSQLTYTVCANNSGGSANASFTLEVLEPRANITYSESTVDLVTGITHLRLRPSISGGVPQSWSVSPTLPEGLRFVNGVVSGVANVSMEATTYTVWANNSGGSATTSFTLQIDWPMHFARYPVPRLVLDVNEPLAPQYPVYSFSDTRGISWAVEPALPAGFNFSNGVIWGTSANVSNETTYTVTVTGEMAPLQLNFILEVRAMEVDGVAPLDNNNTIQEVFIVPEQEVFDTSFNMYYLCPPILIFIMLIGAMAINNYLKRTGYVELDDEGDKPDEEASE